MTFETFDQSDEGTWLDQQKDKRTKTKTMTETNTFREHLQRATLETCDLWDIWSEWWGDMTWPKKYNDNDKYKDKGNYKDNDIDNPRDLSHLRHWSQFWQLRTWFYNNLCCLTIKSDTGQHSQFLRCFFIHCFRSSAPFIEIPLKERRVLIF